MVGYKCPASTSTGKTKNLEHGTVQASHIGMIVRMTHAELLVVVTNICQATEHKRNANQTCTFMLTDYTRSAAHIRSVIVKLFFGWSVILDTMLLPKVKVEDASYLYKQVGPNKESDELSCNTKPTLKVAYGSIFHSW